MPVTCALAVAAILLGGVGDVDAAPAESRVIYLDRGGLDVVPGHDDARHARSSIVKQPVRFEPWDIDDAIWNQVTDCLAELFERFDVSITDRDPGPSVSQIRAVFTHRPDNAFEPGDLGVAPFAGDCGVVENAIVFTFVDGLDPRLICEVQAQEIAHAYGVDHALLDTDVMSYLPRRGSRAFQDEAVSCGELEPRPCGEKVPGPGPGCRPEQNAVRVLADRLGVTAPLDGPIEVTDGCSSLGVTELGSIWLVAIAAIAATRRGAVAAARHGCGAVVASHHVRREYTRGDSAARGRVRTDRFV